MLPTKLLLTSSPPPRSPVEESAVKKTRRKKKTKPSPENPSLPDDLLMTCLARISRLHYRSISLVSKRFRSILALPELYKTRSLLGRTESCLYVCLRLSFDDPNPRWFTLCRMNTKKNKSSCNLLVPIPVPNSPQSLWPAVVSVGSSIYAIGGIINGFPSSDVWVLDCHFHTWRKAPSMGEERTYPTANVFDGKIYVAGGCKDWDSSNWMEVFDPKTQTWESVVCPLLAERLISYVNNSAVIEGKIYHMFGDKPDVAYKPKEDSWEIVEPSSFGLGWTRVYCVIDNVLYCFSDQCGLEWYSFKRQCWMYLKGLETVLPMLSGHSWVKMADYGGKLAVFCTKKLRSSDCMEMMMWCAVIALERRNDDEIWGTVEQLDPVLKLPRSFGFVCAHAATT